MARFANHTGDFTERRWPALQWNESNARGPAVHTSNCLNTSPSYLQCGELARGLHGTGQGIPRSTLFCISDRCSRNGSGGSPAADGVGCWCDQEARPLWMKQCRWLPVDSVMKASDRIRAATVIWNPSLHVWRRPHCQDLECHGENFIDVSSVLHVWSTFTPFLLVNHHSLYGRRLGASILLSLGTRRHRIRQARCVAAGTARLGLLGLSAPGSGAPSAV